MGTENLLKTPETLILAGFVVMCFIVGRAVLAYVDTIISAAHEKELFNRKAGHNHEAGQSKPAHNHEGQSQSRHNHEARRKDMQNFN